MKIRGLASVLCFALLMVLLNVFVVYAAQCTGVNPGQLTGYIDDTTGTRIAGATVSGQTSCTYPAQDGGMSIAEGFYQVYNLVSPSGGSMSTSVSYVHPTYGQGTGFNSKANAGNMEQINVTICYPPTAPTFTTVADSHLTGITFNWVSGIDPVGYTIRDEFAISGGLTYSQIINPATAGGANTITRNLITNRNYNWQVRTCNIPNSAGRSLQDVYCCSPWVGNSFHIGNSAPTAPNGTAWRDPLDPNNIAILNWSSGIDPESDPTYDQFRLITNQIAGEIVGNSTNSALSPVTMPIQTLISWEVRTCDNFGDCSAWVRIDSVFCPSSTTPDCPACNCPPSGGGGGGGGGTTIIRVPVSVPSAQGPDVYCNGQKIDSDILRKVDFQVSGEKLKIVASGDLFSVGDLNVCPSCFDGKKDGDETGIDCGGSCSACSVVKPLVEKFQWLFLVVALLLLFIVGILARPYYYMLRIIISLARGRRALMKNEASALLSSRKQISLKDDKIKNSGVKNG